MKCVSDKKLRLIVFILLFSAIHINRVYANSAQIENFETEGYKSVLLVPEIYNNSNMDLSDIRLEEGSENIPYFINSYEVYEEISYNNYEATLIKSFTKGNDYYFDYEVQGSLNEDTVSTGIKITTQNTNFAKNIELYGSYDNTRWEMILSESIYSVNSNSKLEIFFDKELKYDYFRFKISNNLERISFDAVTVKYNRAVLDTRRFIQSLKPSYTIEQQDKKTLITLEGVRNLKLKDIYIDAEGNFKRYVFIPDFNISGLELYNFKFSEDSYSGTSLNLEGYTCKDNSITIEIDNKDDKPIEIKNIHLNYYADEIVFKAETDRDYIISFGANNEIKAPNYDIASYKGEILKQPIEELVFENISITEDSSDTVRDNRMQVILLNALFGIIILALVVMIVTKLKHV